MASALIWKNVGVSMQSAIAAAKTITGITKANPGVVTSTAHGLLDGDIVYIECQGMTQLNERVARVANKTTDTFQLEGIDTTLFDTFVSGSCYKITLGTTISTARSVTSSGGDFTMIDKTTIHENARSEMPGLPNAISFQMEHIWDSTDAGLAAMKAASDVQGKRVFKFQFGTGGKIMLFSGYVGCTLLPGGSAQDLVTTQSVFTLNGTPTYYSA